MIFADQLRARQLIRTWCDVCRRTAKILDSDRGIYDDTIFVLTRCHGLTRWVRIDERLIAHLGHTIRGVFVAFKRPPLALPPIAPPAPPRVRGRHLPPADPSRTTVYHMGDCWDTFSSNDFKDFVRRTREEIAARPRYSGGET